MNGGSGVSIRGVKIVRVRCFFLKQNQCPHIWVLLHDRRESCQQKDLTGDFISFAKIILVVMCCVTVDGSEIRLTSWEVDFAVIYRVNLCSTINWIRYDPIELGHACQH